MSKNITIEKEKNALFSKSYPIRTRSVVDLLITTKKPNYCGISSVS
jgi:hypothetical protein